MTATLTRPARPRAEMDPRLRARRVAVLRRRGRRRLRALLAVAVLVALACGAYLVARSALFDVDEVAVKGADRTGADAVVEAAAIPLGTPLLDVDLAAARARVAALPWVASVTTERSIGGTVTFVVSERVVAAAVRGADAWLLADPAGRVLDRRQEVPTGVPVVNASLAGATPGTWLPTATMPAIEVAALLPSGLARHVERVETAPLGLRLRDGGVVLLGDTSELDRKYLVAMTILSKVSLTCIDVLDVQVPSAPFLTNLDDCP